MHYSELRTQFGIFRMRHMTNKHAATSQKAMLIIGAAAVKFTVLLFIWEKAPAPNFRKIFFATK